jgi:hypothetical protein
MRPCTAIGVAALAAFAVPAGAGASLTTLRFAHVR